MSKFFIYSVSNNKPYNTISPTENYKIHTIIQINRDGKKKGYTEYSKDDAVKNLAHLTNVPKKNLTVNSVIIQDGITYFIANTFDKYAKEVPFKVVMTGLSNSARIRRRMRHY